MLRKFIPFTNFIGIITGPPRTKKECGFSEVSKVNCWMIICRILQIIKGNITNSNFDHKNTYVIKGNATQEYNRILNFNINIRKRYLQKPWYCII